MKRRHLPGAAGLVLALLLIPAVLLLGGRLPAPLAGLMERFSLFSMQMDMPDQAVAQLRDRLAPDLKETPQPQPDPLPAQQQEDSPEADPPAPAAQTSPAGQPAQQPPDIPEAYRGTLQQGDYSGSANGVTAALNPGFVRNYTSLSLKEIAALAQREPAIAIDPQSGEPQVLIYHTHATESYEPYDTDVYDTRNTWRSLDDSENMVAVGDVLAAALEDQGIRVIHDATQHDYPSYNGGYERSAKTVQQYLEEYPSIQVVLDVHRDAIQPEEGVISKPVVEIEGKKAAQLMIISGVDDGTLGMPNWRENFAFAAGVTRAIENRYPGLCRPIFFANRKYNQDLSTGALLFEFGSNANTLEEAKYSAQLVGEALGEYLIALAAGN